MSKRKKTNGVSGKIDRDRRDRRSTIYITKNSLNSIHTNNIDGMPAFKHIIHNNNPTKVYKNEREELSKNDIVKK